MQHILWFSSPMNTRQPVVAIVGHIDHGKTTLLDYIRSSSVAAREAGGITQRISAYEIVHTSADGTTPITFIDTPGHEAFQAMRRFSAGAADIAILVVAADDGIKPQTREAKKAIDEAKIPFIVCFTKIDKDTANLDRAKESVLKEGIYLEGLGGDVPWAAVSAKTGDGVTELLDLIVLAADLHGISCDPTAAPSAIVIESAKTPQTGVSATIIIKTGTFETGGFVVGGGAFAPLRSIENFEGKRVPSLSCGKPARVSGFNTEPTVGAVLTITKNKKDAEAASERAPSHGGAHAPDGDTILRIILKADSQGALEALQYEVKKVTHESVQLFVVDASVGSITESDVRSLIGFDKPLILGFNVTPSAQAADLAERQAIAIATRTIIYELADWLKEEVVRHAPAPDAEVTGRTTILKTFSVAGTKHVVGARIDEGVIRRGESVTIMRRGIEVGSGRIGNLQAQKKDTGSVTAPNECGMQVDSKSDIVVGDVLETVKRHE